MFECHHESTLQNPPNIPQFCSSEMDTFAMDQFSGRQGSLIEALPLNRFMHERSRLFFDAVNYGNSVDSGLAPSYLPHHSMTWSVQSHTSIGSSALSPPADSDGLYEDTQGPATPGFSEPSPPHDSKMSLPQWDGQHLQHFQFPQTYIPRSDFINPSDISSEQNIGTPLMDIKQESLDLTLTASHIGTTDDISIDPNLVPDGVQHETPYPASIVAPRATSSDDKAILKKEVVQDAFVSGPNQKPKSRQRQRHRRSNNGRNRGVGKVTKSMRESLYKTERVLSRIPEPGRCDFCHEMFEDPVSLQRHTRSQHGRPFTCVFHYAGCSSTFGAKNEWKRHVLSQHLGLHYWHCTLDHCSQSNPLHAHGRSPAPGIPTHGSIFNRKDLYTQHVRRMHLSQDGTKTAAQQAEERLKHLQEGARKKRCELPLYMECPAVGCSKHFEGSNAWDERMEHVAVHLGRAASGKEDDVFFGGEHDLTLTEWAASAEVGVAVPLAGGGWHHRNPLKGTGGSSGSVRRVSSSRHPLEFRMPVTDLDAEGEDIK